jgi:GR25 family glycosyltransferase involved in LPS biosynthesis
MLRVACVLVSTLVSEVEFGEKEGVSSALVEGSGTHEYAQTIDIRHAYFINTDRDVKRRQHMETQLSFWGLNYSRALGVNGSALTALQQQYVEKRGRMHQDIKSGTIGNNLGHLNLWKRLVGKPNGIYLLMEDDILLRPDWLRGIERVAPFVPNDWDVLKLDNRFVGSCSARKNKRGKYGRIRGTQINERVHKLKYAVDDGCNLGLGAYIINKRSNSRMKMMANLFEAKPITVADGNIQFLMDVFNFYLPFDEAPAGKKFRWLETEGLFESTRLEADKSNERGSSAEAKHVRCSSSGVMDCGDFLQGVHSRTYLPCCKHEGLKCSFMKGVGTTICKPVGGG